MSRCVAYFDTFDNKPDGLRYLWFMKDLRDDDMKDERGVENLKSKPTEAGEVHKN